MRRRWLTAGLVAGLVLGTIVPVAAQYMVMGDFTGLNPGTKSVIVCLTTVGNPRGDVRPTVIDSLGAHIEVSCPG